MINFTRRIAIDETESSQVSVAGLIRMGKIKVKHKTAVICILSHWVEKGLLDIKPTATSKGVGGYSLWLTRGIALLDKLLSGEMKDYPLYSEYGDKKWKTTEIKDAIDQLALAALDNAYHPADPGRKKGLRRMNLEVFIWNGGLKGEPKPYTHAPLLFWHENKAKLNDEMLERKQNKRPFLFDSILSLHIAKNGLYGPPTLSNSLYNKLVDTTEKLWTWYRDNRKRLHPNDRTPDLLVNAMSEVLERWTPPVSLYGMTSEAMMKQVMEKLEEKATYVEMIVESAEAAPVEVTELSPTALLGECGPDMVQTLCLYGMQQNVSIQPIFVDSARLACFSNFTLRQVLRKWQKGEFTVAKKEAADTDWRTILQMG